MTLFFGQVKTEQKTDIELETSIDSIKNPVEYIKRESLDGKLNFRKMLVGYGSKDADYKMDLYAIAIWTSAVKDLGITDQKEIIKLWEEIHERKMTGDEKNAVQMGLKNE